MTRKVWLLLAQRGYVKVTDREAFGVSRGSLAVKYGVEDGKWTAFQKRDGQWEEVQAGQGIFAAARLLGLDMKAVTDAITDAG